MTTPCSWHRGLHWRGGAPSAALLFSGRPSALVPAAHHRVRRHSSYPSLAPICKGAYARQRGIGHPQKLCRPHPSSLAPSAEPSTPLFRRREARFAVWLAHLLIAGLYGYAMKATPRELNLCQLLAVGPRCNSVSLVAAHLGIRTRCLSSWELVLRHCRTLVLLASPPSHCKVRNDGGKTHQQTQLQQSRQSSCSSLS